MDNMFRRHRLGWLLLIALPLLLMEGLWRSVLADAIVASDLNKAQQLRLNKGEIIVTIRQTGNPPRGRVAAMILIKAPPESIYQIMLDCQELPNFIPGLTFCNVLESGHNWEIIRHEVKWLWFFPKIAYIFRADYEPNRRIDFTRIKGDLREITGSWCFTPLHQNSETIVNYSVFLDPGFFMPQWVVRRSLKADLPKMLNALRTKVMNSKESFGQK